VKISLHLIKHIFDKQYCRQVHCIADVLHTETREKVVTWKTLRPSKKISNITFHYGSHNYYSKHIHCLFFSLENTHRTIFTSLCNLFETKSVTAMIVLNPGPAQEHCNTLAVYGCQFIYRVHKPTFSSHQVPSLSTQLILGKVRAISSLSC